MNPTAVNFWAVLTGAGWLLTNTVNGAVTGLVVGLTVSLIAEFLPRRRR